MNLRVYILHHFAMGVSQILLMTQYSIWFLFPFSWLETIGAFKTVLVQRSLTCMIRWNTLRYIELHIPSAPCMVYLPLFTYIWVMFRANVGKIFQHHGAYGYHILTGIIWFATGLVFRLLFGCWAQLEGSTPALVAQPPPAQWTRRIANSSLASGSHNMFP